MSLSEQRVCVSGANGFIGAHVVRQLLEGGAYVVGTVRGVTAEKCAHLNALPNASDRLELVTADVLDPQPWPGILAHCDALVHCATAVKFAAKDPQRDIVDVAVLGTQHVLCAAAASERLRSVVHLSSIAAITSHNKPAGYIFTSADWCEDASVSSNPYALGKTLSEKAAWKLAKPSDERTGFRLVSLNPGYVLGPLMASSHLQASPSIVRDMVTRKFPGCPPLNLNLVDVRDVAAAATRALQLPHLSERLLLTSESAWWKELAQTIGARFPERRVRTNVLPTWLLYFNTIFDKRVSLAFLRRSLNRESKADGQAAMNSLAMSYRPLAETVLSTVESMIALGLIRKS